MRPCRDAWRWGRGRARDRWLWGATREAEWVTSRGPRHAHLEGFDLHANVWVSGTIGRGGAALPIPVAAGRRAGSAAATEDGRIVLELKRAWHDGTRELVFEPLELLERLAAMTPTTTSHYTW